MEIEYFSEIINTVAIAKELHSIGRYEVVQTQFSDIVSYDSCYESISGAITSIFSNFYSNYNDDDTTECMILMDEVISNYYCLAWEYGRRFKVPHDQNPYVIKAENEMHRWLNFSYAIDWTLLGYTKSKSAAKKSKLIIYTCNYEFYEHDQLAYSLVMLYKWFANSCKEVIDQRDVMAA